MTTQATTFSRDLLHWYDQHSRTLPWRAKCDDDINPYKVWLAEVMLQQTTVPTVKGYYERFLARWPTVEDLAAAPLDDVLHAWQGLGYYARARNLHACAQEVVQTYNGCFPETEEGLRALKGIGDYTAAAIAAIAFGKHAVVVDGNVERIITRLYRIPSPVKSSKKQIYQYARTLTPTERSGDYAQAMMDLGSSICTPRQPSCQHCPVQSYCQAYVHGDATTYPVKMAKAEKPTRYAHMFWMVDSQGRVALQQRAHQGLLGGMTEIPSSEWTLSPAPPIFPVAAAWQFLPSQVRHTFSHFHLECTLHRAVVQEDMPYIWAHPTEFGKYALPSLIKKVARAAMSAK